MKNDLRFPITIRATIPLSTAANRPNWEALQELLRDSLEGLGIEVEWVGSEVFTDPPRGPVGYVSAATVFDLKHMKPNVIVRLIWKESGPDHDVPIYLMTRGRDHVTEQIQDHDQSKHPPRLSKLSGGVGSSEDKNGKGSDRV